MYTCVLVRMLSFPPSLRTFSKDVVELGMFSRRTTRAIRVMKYLSYKEQINRPGLFSLEKEDEWKGICESMNDMEKVNRKLLFTVSSSTRTRTIASTGSRFIDQNVTFLHPDTKNSLSSGHCGCWKLSWFPKVIGKNHERKKK